MNINFKQPTQLILKLFILLLASSNSLLAQNIFNGNSKLYGTKNTFIFLGKDTSILEILVIDKPSFFINLDTLIRLPNGNYKGRSAKIQFTNKQYLITEMPSIPHFRRKPKVPIKLKQADTTLISRYNTYKENISK